MERQTLARFGAVSILALGIGACASGPAAYNPPERLDDDTRIVSCKLPPQVRRLGQHATYLAAGRVVRTNAADCRVRGGQISELAAAPVAVPAAADGTMAVMVGGDSATPACPVSGEIAGLRSGNLMVRSGPGTTHTILDRLGNGRRVHVCDGTPDEGWLGVVYPAEAGQDCGVGAPLADARTYRGPCRVGWVSSGWVRTGAGQ